MEPNDTDEPVNPYQSLESVWGSVQLIVDDHTGVLFFRHGHKLYRRIVRFDEDT